MVNGIIRAAVSVAFSGAFSLAAFAVPAAAIAGTPDGLSVAVHYNDLDLTSDAGAQALQTRINRAARVVCGSADTRDLRMISEIQQCRQVALNSAAPQVEVAIAQARSGRAYAADANKDVRVAALR